MGYHTEFEGHFTVSPPLDDKTADLINDLNRTRRMKRDMTRIGLPVEVHGVDGELYIDPNELDGCLGFRGKPKPGVELVALDASETIVDHNTPPSTQPGLWCQWCYDQETAQIKWDGGEKFYRYTEWMQYLLKKILVPGGYTVNGTVFYQGEEPDDVGRIIVKDNYILRMHDRYCKGRVGRYCLAAIGKSWRRCHNATKNGDDLCGIHKKANRVRRLDENVRCEGTRQNERRCYYVKEPNKRFCKKCQKLTSG